MSAPVSEEFLQEMYGGDREFLRDVTDTFFAEMQERLPRLQEAVRTFDAQAVAALAHASVGSAGCIGAERFQASARALEACGKSRQANVAGELLACFESEVQALRDFFDAYLRNL